MPTAFAPCSASRRASPASAPAWVTTSSNPAATKTSRALACMFSNRTMRGMWTLSGKGKTFIVRYFKLLVRVIPNEGRVKTHKFHGYSMFGDICSYPYGGVAPRSGVRRPMPRKSRTVLPAAVTSDIISKVVSTMVTSFAYDTPPSQPAIRRRTRTARDADDHARNLSQWEQSYDQFSSGDFQGRLTELWLPRLQLFQESANQALRQSCAAWRDSLWFGLPAPHQQVSRLDALPIPDHTLLFRPGARQFELNTPQDYNIFGIVLDQDLLREHLTPQDEDIS